jgi:IS5 family transposase
MKSTPQNANERGIERCESPGIRRTQRNASKGVIRLDQTSHLSILLASLLLDDFTEEIAGATLL